MRISSVHIRNFKRFTDLLIRDIPESARLVLVVGPNGCGKSSLFDAFLAWYRGNARFGMNPDDAYYKKDQSQAFRWNSDITVSLHGDRVPKRGCLYVRTAYRNDPDFSVTAFSRQESPSDVLSINRLIDNDQAVSANYQRLIYQTMSGVYNSGNDDKTVRALREELIGDVRKSMEAVFGDLLLNSISDPLGAGSFFFGKGAVDAYHYKNLSGGEKAAFDLLLDLHVKKKSFSDAIYCIDELDAHLHTRVQAALLREIVNILPGDSQLWATTHSLGVIRGAQELAAADPSSVCILDFDGVELDASNELRPSNLGRIAWEKLLSITLDDLSKQIAPKHVVVCEGSSLGNRRQDFDAEIYNRILGSRYPDVVFVSGGASSEVAASGVSVKSLLEKLLPYASVHVLCDRDDLSDDQVSEHQRNGMLVLRRRNLESYVMDDEVLKALLQKEGKAECWDEVSKIKAAAIAASVTRGNARDDIKSAAGEIYTEVKKLLALVQCGNDTASFMRDTLAPLVDTSMVCYSELKDTVIDHVASATG